MKDFKQVKRLKRSDLIAEKEREKLRHRFNKEQRKEKRKSEYQSKSKENATKPETSTKQEKKFLTSQKKSQLEYEAKKKEKLAKIEVKNKLIMSIIFISIYDEYNRMFRKRKSVKKRSKRPKRYIKRPENKSSVTCVKRVNRDRY